MPLALLLWGCPEPIGVDEQPLASPYEALPDALLLRRLSLDLRGVVPTLDELEQVEADPDALWTLRDAFLDDPRFRERLVHLLAERWLTRWEEQEISHVDYHLDDDQAFDYHVAFGSEPLQLMAEVAVHDEPWPTVVTADWTVANELLGEIWPLDRDEGEGWQRATWTDGRPAAGVLATNGLWWRYLSNGGNEQRARVAAMSRLLLCEDYLERPVTFSRTAGLDADATDAALSTDPGCLACHASIEPLRVVFYGFQTLIQYNAHEADRYHPEREREGLLGEGIEPAYFGTPIDGLADLGRMIAGDSRFYRCTAEQAASSLWRRDVVAADFEVVDELRAGFVSTGFLYRDLLAAVTETPSYTAGGLDEAVATDEQWSIEVVQRMVTPDQYDTLVEELTGFTWFDEGGWNLLRSDRYGFRVMAGGVDGVMVTSPQQDPGLTWALVLKRHAESAGFHVVQTELVDGEAGQGFFVQDLDLDSRPGDPAFSEQLATSWLRLTSEALDGELQASYEALWEELESAGDAEQAWSSLVAVMLRDPKVVTY